VLTSEVMAGEIPSSWPWDRPSCHFSLFPITGDGCQKNIGSTRFQPGWSPAADSGARGGPAVPCQEEVKVPKIFFLGLVEQPCHELPILKSDIVYAGRSGRKAGR